ncbi:hypothetical protein PPL_00864 [Heterostelium album PN500]|uniref:B box-type domain-containing protein n=1 Tax=Heterostelium pallidum (strain ATCC 26659 / Pp 5 / PN500) TaxID=670386 RepID=D3AYU5_HETP5|nr:hypothetical protein PPL_00864 [Heterostelium album PN500]EFA85635.1 hypothetical protein PPL_00864 [Heterostelium album PN500]|eukprot:XP_020437742.1 hypothetical protein PPL_00864 [Heterostelium album PN500]
MKQLSFQSILFDIYHNIHKDDIICPSHKREIEVLCVECQKLVCYKCSSTLHRNHQFITIDDIKESFIDKEEEDDDYENDSNEIDKDSVKEKEKLKDIDSDVEFEKNEYLSRILKVWKTMKIQSEQYQILKDKESAIAKTFSELHETLRITEHKLLRPINEIKEQVGNSIDSKLKEIQSLNTLVNIILKSISKDNNNQSNNNNNNNDNDNDVDNNNQVVGNDSEESNNDKYQLDSIIDSIYSTNTLSRFQHLHNETLFYNTQKDKNNNNNKNNKNNVDDYSILRLIQQYYNYYGGHYQHQQEDEQQDNNIAECVVDKEILSIDDSIQNLKVDPAKLEYLKNRYKELLNFVENDTPLNELDNLSDINTTPSVTNSSNNITIKNNSIIQIVNLSNSSNSVFSNDDSSDTNNNLNSSFNDLLLQNDNDEQQQQQQLSPLSQQQQQQPKQYIFSLGYDDGSVSLIDVSNSSIEIVSGDHVYIFGGLGFHKQYHRYSIKSRRIDYQAEMNGVAGDRDKWITIDHNDKSSRFECGAVLI